MKRTLTFDVTYPHPPRKVWRAIATSDGLAAWLMPNDFAPIVGHEFTFRTKPAPGFDGIVHCRILEIDPPNRLVYSWRGGAIDTIVTYTLSAAGDGTRMRFEQKGFDGVKSVMISLILGSGCKKLFGRMLPEVLGRIGEDGRLAPAPIEECRHHSAGTMFIARLAKLVPGRSK